MNKMTDKEWLERIQQELRKRGLLRQVPDESGFVVSLVSGYPIGAVRLEMAWFHADYDAKMLADLLWRLQPKDTEGDDGRSDPDRGVPNYATIWDLIGPAELWPENGQERLARKIAIAEKAALESKEQ